MFERRFYDAGFREDRLSHRRRSARDWGVPDLHISLYTNQISSLTWWLWPMFPLRKFYTEQMLVLVSTQSHNHVDAQLVKRFKRKRAMRYICNIKFGIFQVHANEISLRAFAHLWGNTGRMYVPERSAQSLVKYIVLFEFPLAVLPLAQWFSNCGTRTTSGAWVLFRRYASSFPVTFETLC